MEKKRIAVHEADHLTVCYQLGWNIKNIIKTNESPYSICYEKRGFEYYSNPLNKIQKEHNFERICISWGGGIMEEREFGNLWNKNGRKSIYGDEQTVKKLLQYNREGIKHSKLAMMKSEMILMKNRKFCCRIADVILDFLLNPIDFEKHKHDLNDRFIQAPTG